MKARLVSSINRYSGGGLQGSLEPFTGGSLGNAVWYEDDVICGRAFLAIAVNVPMPYEKWRTKNPKGSSIA
jgi:hypothetical protein